MRKPRPPEARVFLNDFKGPSGPFLHLERFEPSDLNLTYGLKLLRDKCRICVH